MKTVMLVVLTCSMIGFSAKAVNPTITVRVGVASDVNEGLMKAYLERELRKIAGVEVREVAEWEIRIVSVRLPNGLYARAISVIKNRYIRSYLKPTLAKETQDALAVIPEAYTTFVQTGYELDDMSERTAVSLESYFLR